MTHEDRFEPGHYYFLLGYYDREFRFPLIQTYVFIGKNIEGDGTAEDRWYFQEPKAFLRRQRDDAGIGDTESGIITATKESLEGFVDLSGLIAELSGRKK